jgi:2-polyprenyl-6-methoxyphenol hydroxylase-like FAD-dependent oxidoreductase
MTLPPGCSWAHQTGLTLVGDAAHVMPPLGTGVNLAMLDAAELAENLVQADDWRQALQHSERAMLTRSAPVAHQCIAAFGQMFSDTALQSTMEHFDAVHHDS